VPGDRVEAAVGQQSEPHTLAAESLMTASVGSTIVG
jgi:hypothetical protein